MSGVRDSIVIEYVELCEQIAAVELLEGVEVEETLYGRLDQLWYVEMSDEERREVEDRLVARARAWHDDRRAGDP